MKHSRGPAVQHVYCPPRWLLTVVSLTATALLAGATGEPPPAEPKDCSATTRPERHTDPASAWAGIFFTFPHEVQWNSSIATTRGSDRRSLVARGRDAWGPVELVIVEVGGYLAGNLSDGTGASWSARESVGHPLVFRKVDVQQLGYPRETASPKTYTNVGGDFPPIVDQQDEGGLAGSCTDSESVEVLVVYTPCALGQSGSLGQLLADLFLGEVMTNTVFTNSAIDTVGHPRSISIAAVQPSESQVCDIEPTFAEHLATVSDVNTPLGGAVGQMRDYHRADLVILVRGGAGVLAYTKNLDSGCVSTQSFCVIGEGSLGIDATAMTYAIGKLFGCCNAPGDAGSCWQGAIYPYSSGHRFVGDNQVQYRTIMTFYPGNPISHFSNPDVSFEGEPTGTSEADQSQLGYWSDNARTIRETFDDVRCYRCSDLPPAPDPPGPNGPVVCWGNNSSGESSPPANLSACEAIAAGTAFTVVIGADHMVRGWGSNTYGQLTIPANLGACRSIAAGKGHVVVITGTATSGPVRAWGLDPESQSTVPTTVGSCTSIAAGERHSLAVRVDVGTVAAWGDNTAGQCTPPTNLGSCIETAGGNTHSVALRTDGVVRCWGSNSSGQGTPTTGMPACVAIAAGYGHTVALDINGKVWAWGANNFGQITVPATLTVATAIAAGGAHTIAIQDGGAGQDTVVAFGAGAVSTGVDPHWGQCLVPANFTGPILIDGGNHHTAIIATTANFNGCIGDFNNDGSRDGTDLTAVLSGWGTAAFDCNGDGITDGLDLTFLLSGWGACE